MSVYEVLVWSYYASLALATAVGVLRWRRLDSSGKVLWATVAASLLIEAARYRVQQGEPEVHEWNVTLLNVVPLVEIFGYGMAYLLFFSPRPPAGKIALLGAGAAAAAALNSRFFQSWDSMQGNLMLLESLLLTGAAVHVLYHLAVAPEVRSFVREPHFWAWSVVLVYQCSTAAFWGALPVLDKGSGEWVLADRLHTAVNILEYFVLAVAFLLYRAKPTPQL